MVLIFIKIKINSDGINNTSIIELKLLYNCKYLIYNINRIIRLSNKRIDHNSFKLIYYNYQNIIVLLLLLYQQCIVIIPF